MRFIYRKKTIPVAMALPNAAHVLEASCFTALFDACSFQREDPRCLLPLRYERPTEPAE
jgi:hypothetical protein